MDTTTVNPQPVSQGTASRDARDHRPQPLYRPTQDRMLAGVASGLACYLGADVTLVRIILAVLAIAGPGVPLYLAGWLLIPEEGASQSIAADLIQSLRARSS